MKDRISERLSAEQPLDEDTRKLLIDAREYIDFLEKRLKHSVEMYDRAMEMVNKLVKKIK